MEFLPKLGDTALVGAVIVLLFIWNVWMKSRAKQTKGKAMTAPEAPGAWPIIGHLPLLGGQQPVARTLAAVADKKGPAFMLQLGVHRALVVSSWELIKDCFTTNDGAFATRPRHTIGKYLGYNFALFVFTPYGPYWREIRKIATQELLSKSRLDMLKDVRANEVDICIKRLYSFWSKDNNGTINMSQWFDHLLFNVLTKMIAGKRYFGVVDEGEDQTEAHRFQEAIERFMYLSGLFDIADILPYLEWMDLQGNVKAMKSVAKELDFLIGNWVEEHHHKIQKRLPGEAKRAESELDFIDVMLSNFKEEEAAQFGYDRNTIIKATALTLILGGTETTAVTSTWALSLLVSNQHVLKKAQEELDVHVGRDRIVDESDIKNLVYLNAVVKETLRIYPVGPLGIPHEAMEDCVVGGYHVPKGTRLIVNLWKLHRDPRVWSDPYEYKPERFLYGDEADRDYRGRHFEYLPFSSGRRMCPGVIFSSQVIHLALARLLQGFNFTTPQQKPVDMTEGLGISLPKKNPLEVIITPRLPSKLYE